MFGREICYDGGGLKPGMIYGSGDFQANGASQPSALTVKWQGGSLGQNVGSTSPTVQPMFSVNRTGVGVWAITMSKEFTFVQPPVIEAANTWVTTSYWCNVEYVTGGWLNSTRTFNIHAWTNAGAAMDPAADAGNRISFFIEGLDNGGKG
jgi:hypothetical protein